MIDLHQHSTLSDGTDNVEELIEKNKKLGVSVMAITDHDNIDSVKEAKLFNDGIIMISGVEFSTDFCGESIHILCYGFDEDDKIVSGLVEEGAVLRRKRIEFRLDLLKNEFGIELDFDTLNKIYSSKNPNKPMIANILKDLGYGNDIGVIIKKYLYHKMPDFKLKTLDVLQRLSKSSGISVYAHSLGGVGEKRVEKTVFEARLKQFVAAGLKGLECYYSLYNQQEQKYLVGKAEEYCLLVSGGSDYHGKNKTVSIGEISSDGIVAEDKKFTILSKLIK